MATLIFSTVGKFFGGPIGAAIGAFAGRQIDSLIMGSGSAEGPRLKDLAVTGSSYGSAIPRHFGKMRVPGTIIWATDLVEHKQSQGGGKGRPSTTTYSYTASFAVALSSRPINSVGRIWADGNLVRGSAGDLKTNGTLRIYTGEGDQKPDPIIAAHESAALCPAWRGLAYAVFEDLELGDFYNRIPALTFEVFADSEPLTVGILFEDILEDFSAQLPLQGVDGISCEGSLADALNQLEPIFPIDCDSGGAQLIFAKGNAQNQAFVMSEAAVSVADGDFGGPSGYARKREPLPVSPTQALRYYDIERDYQPGVQRASGRAGPGQPRTVELPAAITAANARVLAERMAHRASWARETIAWRTRELNPAIGPGSLVAIDGQAGHWRVSDWEWRDTGVEYTLTRIAPSANDLASTSANLPTDPGRANSPLDEPAPPTVLAAIELPWDGSGTGDTPALIAVTSSPGLSWKGAALFVDHGDGALQPLGSSGRNRVVMGAAVDVLGISSPQLIDRSHSVTVELIAADMALSGATTSDLARGANRALLGDEIIQFARAEPLPNNRWRLSGLLRGRGGTEGGIRGHAIGDRFALLDGQATVLDTALVGSANSAQIAALGLGDSVPVASPFALPGITQRPLSPVHPRAETLADGSLDLRWTRRSRGSWTWPDSVDAPLHEQTEAYVVTYGPIDSPIATWQVTAPNLTISASQKAALAATLPAEAFRVRQIGTYALSDVLDLRA